MATEIEKFYAQRQHISDEIKLEESMKLITEGDRLRRLEEEIKKNNLQMLDGEALEVAAGEIDVKTVISAYDPFISQDCYNLVQILNNSDCKNPCCKVKETFHRLLKNAIGGETSAVAESGGNIFDFDLEKYFESRGAIEAMNWTLENFKNKPC